MDSRGFLRCMDMEAQDVIHVSSPGCGPSPEWIRSVFILAPVGKCSRWEEDQPPKPAPNDPTPVNERKAPALRSLSEGEEEELETGTPVSAGALTMEGGHEAGQPVDLYPWSSESRQRHSHASVASRPASAEEALLTPYNQTPEFLQCFMCPNGFFPLLPQSCQQTPYLHILHSGCSKLMACFPRLSHLLSPFLPSHHGDS